MKIGDKVSISPQVTDRTDWIEGTIIEIEKKSICRYCYYCKIS